MNTFATRRSLIARCSFCATIFLLLCSSSYADDPMLYFFTSKGCAPCIQVKHVVRQLGSEGYPVTTVNVSERPDWADAFRVTRTPTLVLVQGKQVLAYQPRPMRAQELRDWFKTIRFVPGQPVAKDIASVDTRIRPSQTKVSLPRSGSEASSATFASATMHKGTRSPANAMERRSLDATVRLRVEDSGGISYATGTIVHSHEGESLVMTCGHVFRESKGEGRIIAEIGFGDGEVIEVPGKVLDYDSDANDIALVAICNGSYPVTAVEIADSNLRVERGERVFSLGCDNGDDPTIRNSAIKNIARYDGAMKYDIFGRPVNGRSGGGLFNSKGELIGVCNAAAVEVDEGIYTALETVHWQLARANLDHLFRDMPHDRQMPANAGTGRAEFAQKSNVSNPKRMVPIPRKGAGDLSYAANNRNRGIGPRQPFPLTNVGFEQRLNSTDKEVVITVRSKSNPRDSRTITISDPTPKLLDYLGSMEGTGKRSLQMAAYRELK